MSPIQRPNPPRIRVSFQDLGVILGVHLPVLAAGLPAARERLRELRKSDAVLAPIIDSLLDIYKLITT